MYRSRWFVVAGTLFLLVGSLSMSEVRGDKDEERSEREWKAMMRGWTKALAVKCSHCHVREGKSWNYEKWTPMRRLAHECEEEFVEKLVTAKGAELKCASCHDKKTKFLPRPEQLPEKLDQKTQKAVADYCKDNFVKELKAKNEKGKPKSISCTTCHKDKDGDRFLQAARKKDGDDEGDGDDEKEEDKGKS